MNYNTVKGVNHKYVDAKESQLQLLRVCSCNHLTPAAEAAMDNLIGTDDETVARFTDGVITGNLPKEEEVPSAWDAEPTREALDAIESEESLVDCCGRIAD